MNKNSLENLDTTPTNSKNSFIDWWSTDCDSYDNGFKLEEKEISEIYEKVKKFDELAEEKFNKKCKEFPKKKKFFEAFKSYLRRILLIQNLNYFYYKNGTNLINLTVREKAKLFEKKNIFQLIKYIAMQVIPQFKKSAFDKTKSLKKNPYVSDINFLLIFKPWCINLQSHSYNEDLRMFWDIREMELVKKESFNNELLEMEEFLDCLMADGILSFLSTWYMLICLDIFNYFDEFLNSETAISNTVHYIIAGVLNLTPNKGKISKLIIAFYTLLSKYSFILEKTIFKPIFGEKVLSNFIFKLIVTVVTTSFIKFVFQVTSNVLYVVYNILIILYYKLYIKILKFTKFFIKYIVRDNNFKLRAIGSSLFVISAFLVFTFYATLIMFYFSSYLLTVQLHEYVVFITPFCTFVGLVLLVISKKELLYILHQRLKHVVFPFILSLVNFYFGEFVFSEVDYDKKFNDTFVDFLFPNNVPDFNKKFKALYKFRHVDTFYVQRWENLNIKPEFLTNKARHSQWKNISKAVINDSIFWQKQYFANDIPMFNLNIGLKSPLNNFKSTGIYDMWSPFVHRSCNFIPFSKTVLKKNLKLFRFPTFKLFMTKNTTGYLDNYLTKRKKIGYKVFDISKKDQGKFMSLWGYDQHNYDIMIIGPFYCHYMFIYDFIVKSARAAATHDVLGHKINQKINLFFEPVTGSRFENDLKGYKGRTFTWASKFINLTSKFVEGPNETLYLSLVQPYFITGASLFYCLMILINFGYFMVIEDYFSIEGEKKEAQLLSKKDYELLEEDKKEEFAVASHIYSEPEWESCMEEDAESYFDWYQHNYISNELNYKNEDQKFAFEYYLGTHKPDVQSYGGGHTFNITDCSNMPSDLVKKPFQSHIWDVPKLDVASSESVILLCNEYFETAAVSNSTSFYPNTLINNANNEVLIYGENNFKDSKFDQFLFTSRKNYSLLLLVHQYFVNHLGLCLDKDGTQSFDLSMLGNLQGLFNEYAFVQWLCDQWYDDALLLLKEPDSLEIANTLNFNHEENSAYIQKKLSYILKSEKERLSNCLHSTQSQIYSEANTVAKQSVENILAFSTDCDDNIDKICSITDYYIITDFAAEDFSEDFFWELCKLKLQNCLEFEKEFFEKYKKLKEIFMSSIEFIEETPSIFEGGAKFKKLLKDLKNAEILSTLAEDIKTKENDNESELLKSLHDGKITEVILLAQENDELLDPFHTPARLVIKLKSNFIKFVLSYKTFNVVYTRIKDLYLCYHQTHKKK